jgi:hypothetical protein
VYERYREALSHVKAITLQIRSASSKMMPPTPPIQLHFQNICRLCTATEASGEAVGWVGWSTPLKDASSWLRFSRESLEVSTDLILSPALYSWVRLSLYQKWVLGIHLWARGKEGQCVRLTTLPPSCPYFLEIWKLQLSGILRACSDLNRDCFTYIEQHRPNVWQKSLLLLFKFF